MKSLPQIYQNNRENFSNALGEIFETLILKVLGALNFKLFFDSSEERRFEKDHLFDIF